MKNEGGFGRSRGARRSLASGSEAKPRVGVTTFGRRREEPQAARCFFFADGDEKMVTTTRL